MVEVSAAGYANSGRNLPVVFGTQTERRPFHQARVKSDFASQLIAARDQMPVQRQRRREGEAIVVLAYDRSARLSERRIPQGYRLSVEA
jgi:hypothetical protein